MSTLETLHDRGSREMANFIIDLEDEDCPKFHLHLAAYQGDIEQLTTLLKEDEFKKLIEARIRPFLATPLRLAATAGCQESIRLLLEYVENIDQVDVKAQTPLFVAMVNRHWDCARVLLEKGADPNGDIRNLCTPLAVMAQRGYYEGVRLLCRYGADTEDIARISAGLPGFPITITATYHHLKCFAALLLHGALPDLSCLHKLGLSQSIISQYSVPHAIIKYRCPPEFVYLYREFGGDLSLKDDQGRLATEIAENAPGLKVMKALQEHPLSLQSCCRLAIREQLRPHRLSQIKNLYIKDVASDEIYGLSPNIVDFLEYRELFLSVGQLPESDLWKNSSHSSAIMRLGKVIREVIDDGPIVCPINSSSKQHGISQEQFQAFRDDLEDMEELSRDTVNQPISMAQQNLIHVNPVAMPRGPEIAHQREGAPPPPPPPPPPIPPRPKLWRFPEAEFGNKGVRR